jgi:hypothetical protein
VALSLIDTDTATFDILFLLETWHVEHATRLLHPLVLAATKPIGPPPPNGRYSGGVTVLCTARARSLITDMVISPLGEAITVHTSVGMMTGLYLTLPPQPLWRFYKNHPRLSILLGSHLWRCERPFQAYWHPVWKSSASRPFSGFLELDGSSGLLLPSTFACLRPGCDL